MTKKGPLGKAEQFYIEEKHKELTVDELCKELDRPKASVKRCILKCIKKEEEAEEAAKKVFIPSSQFAVSNGSVMMTPNAAARGDDVMKAARTNETERQRACTTSIFKKPEGD